MSVASSGPVRRREIAYYRPVLGRRHLARRYWSTWFGLGLLALLAPLPLLLSRSVGSAIGLLMWATNAKRRRVVRVNLRFCFPDMTEAQRASLARRHFIVYGQSFTDLAHLAWSSRRRLARMARIVGVEHYRAQLRAGRRVILLVPHFVGINFSGPLLGREHPTFTMIKPLRNPVFDWFLNRARLRFGGGTLARDQGLRPAVQALKQGETFHYSPDEDLGPEHSVFAPFFDVPTATLPTLGRLAQMTQAVVIPCGTRLRTWGRGYEIVLHAPLDGFPSGDEVIDSARMNRAIEAVVREMPEQYMWTLKLFRTRPDGATSPYDAN